MFVSPSKLWSQTCSMIMVRENTRPGLAARYSSSAYSLGVSSILRPARRTCCVRRSTSRSATRSTLERVTGARQRLHPHDQLGEGKRLGEVVVRAGFEVVHLLLGRIAGREDEDRHLLVLATDAPQQLRAA